MAKVLGREESCINEDMRSKLTEMRRRFPDQTSRGLVGENDEELVLISNLILVEESLVEIIWKREGERGCIMRIPLCRVLV